MPLSRLLYVSQSCLQDGEQTTGEQVRAIAEASSERNEKVGVTGVLLFVDDHFIQVLEGEPRVVEETFERICCDFSHEQVKLVDLISVKERLFGEWDMAILSADNETSIALRDELQHIRFLMGVNARAAVDQMRECLHNHANSGSIVLHEGAIAA